MTENVLDRIAGFWDAQAKSFDDEPDHGLSDPVVRDAWMVRLRSWLPAPPAEVVDLGCGTGTLSVLLAGAGFTVRGVDLSAQMIQAARAKAAAAGLDVGFQQGDAAAHRSRRHRSTWCSSGTCCGPCPTRTGRW